VTGDGHRKCEFALEAESISEYPRQIVLRIVRYPRPQPQPPSIDGLALRVPFATFSFPSRLLDWLDCLSSLSLMDVAVRPRFRDESRRVPLGQQRRLLFGWRWDYYSGYMCWRDAHWPFNAFPVPPTSTASVHITSRPRYIKVSLRPRVESTLLSRSDLLCFPGIGIFLTRHRVTH
jgi:hypothetical protein